MKSILRCVALEPVDRGARRASHRAGSRCDAALDARDRHLGLLLGRSSAGAHHQVGPDGEDRHRVAPGPDVQGRPRHVLRQRRHSAGSGAAGRQGHLRQGLPGEGIERPCADRTDLCGGRRARRPAGGAHPQVRPAGALWREQFGAANRRARRSPHRPGAEDHQARPCAQRRAVLARHRGAAGAVHGHHGGLSAARRPAGEFAPAGALGRQHGLQQADRGIDALSARVQHRRAVLHRRLACGAGRRRDQRHRDRSFAHRHHAVHRPQGRGTRDALAARRGRRELLRHGHRPRSRFGDAARRRRRPSTSCASGSACRRRTPMRSPASASISASPRRWTRRR